MNEAAWLQIELASRRLAQDERASVHLSHMAIAVTLAGRSGLLSAKKRSPTGGDLKHSIRDIAITSGQKFHGAAKDWNTLAVTILDCVSPYQASELVDWLANTSQSHDPHRKTRGAYPTPVKLADHLAAATIRPFIGRPDIPRVLDPSAGTGALLISCFRKLVSAKGQNGRELLYNLCGVEIDPLARELCCLLLWISGALYKPKLERILESIELDNALTKSWTGRDKFCVLVMNPPWDSLRFQVHSSHPDSEARLATVQRIEESKPLDEGLPPLFSCQGKGDKNLFKAFVELAPHLVRDGGRVGALIPAAFASDLGMAKLRRLYFDNVAIDRWTSFENLKGYFPIDTRYKFGILTGTKSVRGTRTLAIRSFACEAAEVEAPHVILQRKSLERIGGVNELLPEIQSGLELRTLLQILDNGTKLFSLGSLGKVTYRRELDLTLGKKANLFHRFEDVGHPTPLQTGRFKSGREIFVPVVEGRMVAQYDCFQKSWISGSGRSAVWKENGRADLRKCRPQYLAPLPKPISNRVAFCDVTSATNTRTVHATLVPDHWVCGNTAPILQFETQEFALAGLAILNSVVFDWLTRRLVAGLHLNKFYLELLVWPKLSKEGLHKLISSAVCLCAENNRYAVAGIKLPKLSESDRVDVSTEARLNVELELSKAFGLDREMLEQIFDASRDNRRGFWRYYEDHPVGLEIGRKVIELVNKQRPALRMTG